MELEIIRTIQSIANPFFDVLFQIFTIFGEELILISIITSYYKDIVDAIFNLKYLSIKL